MTTSRTIRVAAAQFHVGSDVEANLQTCLRMLNKANSCNPDLVVLPEFCNHLSWYDDKQHCFDVSVQVDGPFLAAIAAKASELGIHVVVNCTVQREDGTATGSSLLYSPEGRLLSDNTKQIYIGHENDFLERATCEGPVVETELGRIGLYACMDGVINETPRALALNGAQLMLNSLNSFATDEASLHIPVRAAENKVFVIAANKVGPLVPEAMVDGISAATGIPVNFLSGAGESQIVAPDGTVLAKASLDKEEVVYADIDVSQADDKTRPDGTDIFASRRPELYGPVVSDPREQILPPMTGSATVDSAIVQLPEGYELSDARSAVEEAVAQGAKFIALPPLPGYGVDELVESLAPVCGDSVVATATGVDSVREGQCALLLDARGVLLEQGRVHRCAGDPDAVLVDQFSTAELPFGRAAVLLSSDSIYPETFRLLALAGVELAAVPLSPVEGWELQTGLLERAAENRINLLVAPDRFEYGPGFGASLQTDFTVMTEWQERPFDGLLSQPEWHRCESRPGIFRITLRPANAAHKVVSQNTDLLGNRPWDLCGVIAR